jgi:acrylyl-CoA reductase (NADPH)
MNYNGTVAACGLAGGYHLPTTVMPFILRNVRLQGVDSVHTPLHRRQTAWERLAGILPDSFYQQAPQEITLGTGTGHRRRAAESSSNRSHSG